MHDPIRTICTFGGWEYRVKLSPHHTVSFLCGYVAGKAGANIEDAFDIVLDGKVIPGEVCVSVLNNREVDLVAFGDVV